MTQLNVECIRVDILKSPLHGRLLHLVTWIPLSSILCIDFVFLFGTFGMLKHFSLGQIVDQFDDNTSIQIASASNPYLIVITYAPVMTMS